MKTILVALIAAFALPSYASAVTFGANLDQRTANSSATCGFPPYYPGLSPWGSSCTFFSTATPTGEASETQVVPLLDPAAHGNQSGTITEVRIKTGAYQSGPAKLTVLRAHRAVNGGEAACCVGQAESAQFTLTPNSVVHVATNLPVESKYDATQRIYTFDTLALTVLDQSTPIPATFSGDPNGYCSTGYFPYVETGQERLSADYNVCGFLVLMQADMTVNGGHTPTPVAGTTPAFPKTRVDISKGNARIQLQCKGSAVCEGILRLQNRATGRTARAQTSGKKLVTYGTAKFSISSGATKTVKVALSRVGKRLVRRHKRMDVYANVTGKNSTASVTKKLTLRLR